jgi:hypothetical protein
MITFFSVTEMLGSGFSFSVFPAIYALTSNRKRKTYEEIINVVLNLAADRKTILSVKTIVSDYEEAWLRAVEKMVSYFVLHSAK